MRFLFVVDNLKSDCGANVNIAMSLSNELRKEGHSVYAITKQNIDSIVSPENTRAFDDVMFFEEKYYNRIMMHTRNASWKQKNRIEKAVIYLTHPGLLKAWLEMHIIGKMCLMYKKSIIRICKAKEIDAIVAFSFPYFTAEIVGKTKIDITKIVFQLDPYVYHKLIDSKGFDYRKRNAKKVMSHVNRVFVPELLYKEIEKKKELMIKNKIIPFQFPGIKRFAFDESVAKKNDTNHIMFFYVGRLYDEIRNPEYVLKLWTQLPEEYELHIVGDGAKNTIEKYKDILNSRLIQYGSLPVNKAYELMGEADILININNTIDNQLSSKLFDYINTGKPIVNICKLDNCPSLEYINRYPLAYTIFEKIGVTEEVIHGMQEFVNSSIGKRVTKEEILNKYYDCTDEYVANQLLESIS